MSEKKKKKKPHKHKWVVGFLPGVFECSICGKPKVMVD